MNFKKVGFPPLLKHGPGPRFQIAFAGWSKDFAVPVAFQEFIVRTVRAAHRLTGQIQDLVERQATPISEARDQVSRMQDEGGNVSGQAPYLKQV